MSISQETAQSREYIESRSQPIPHAGCWAWLLSLGTHGYGQAWTGKTVTTAHRLSYQAFRGDIPAGMLVQHSCDNKWCVNPDHLSLGTDKTNAIDKQINGRAARKIAFGDRKKIRDLYAAGRTQASLAAEFVVSKRAIWQVIHRYGAHGKGTTEA